MTTDDWERLREYLKQFGELDPQFKYIGTSRSGLATHDYTEPEVLKKPLDAERAAEVEVHAAS